MSEPSEGSDAAAWLERWRTEAGALAWEQPFEQVSTGEGARRRWFPGGTLNAAVNCLDRHLPGRAGQVAIHWEGEPGDRRSLTYAELHAEVCAAAAGLAGLGVGAGDRVALYVGLVPEAVTMALACARLGAVHVIVPQALPVEALADRLALVNPRLLVTTDAAWRHGVLLPLKARADEALAAVGSVEATVVIRRAGLDVAWYEGDVAYQDLLTAGRAQGEAGAGAPVAVPSDHPLLVMHLANRQGHPTGIVHGTAGYLAAVLALHRQALTSAPSSWPGPGSRRASTARWRPGARPCSTKGCSTRPAAPGPGRSSTATGCTRSSPHRRSSASCGRGATPAPVISPSTRSGSWSPGASGSTPPAQTGWSRR